MKKTLFTFKSLFKKTKRARSLGSLLAIALSLETSVHAQTMTDFVFEPYSFSGLSNFSNLADFSFQITNLPFMVDLAAGNLGTAQIFWFVDLKTGAFNNYNLQTPALTVDKMLGVMQSQPEVGTLTGVVDGGTATGMNDFLFNLSPTDLISTFVPLADVPLTLSTPSADKTTPARQIAASASAAIDGNDVDAPVSNLVRKNLVMSLSLKNMGFEVQMYYPDDSDAGRRNLKIARTELGAYDANGVQTSVTTEYNAIDFYKMTYGKKDQPQDAAATDEIYTVFPTLADSYLSDLAWYPDLNTLKNTNAQNTSNCGCTGPMVPVDATESGVKGISSGSAFMVQTSKGVKLVTAGHVASFNERPNSDGLNATDVGFSNGTVLKFSQGSNTQTPISSQMEYIGYNANTDAAVFTPQSSALPQTSYTLLASRPAVGTAVLILGYPNYSVDGTPVRPLTVGVAVVDSYSDNGFMNLVIMGDQLPITRGNSGGAIVLANNPNIVVGLTSALVPNLDVVRVTTITASPSSATGMRFNPVN